MHMWERTGFCLRKTMLRYTEQRGQYLPDTINRHVRNRVCVMLFLIVIIPLISGEAYALRNLYIQRPQLAFNLSFEYDKDIRIISSQKSEDSASRFREGVEISTSGWVYHPALLVYSFTYTPEWEQSNTTSLSDEDSFFQGFSADMTFLQFKPYTLNLYARRNRSRIRSNFAETSRLNSDTYGARLSLKYKLLPTVLSYSHLESDQTGFYNTDTNQDRYNLVMSHRRQRGAITLSAFYSDLSQQINNVLLDNEVKHVDVRNNITFFEKNNMTLDSSFTYEDSISTNIDEELYGVRESLIWHLKSNLKTKYVFFYETRDRFDNILLSPIPRETTSHSLSFNHGLYENLTTNINADFNDIKVGGNREEQYGVGIFWDYKRRIPWGKLGIVIGQSYRNVKVLESEDFSSIIDEPHIINDISDTFIANDDIDLNSILITDSLGNLLLEDIHYTLVETGGFTGIRCKPGLLDCSAGVQVLVDYRFRSRFPFDYSTRNQSYGMTLNLWSYLDLHYRFTKYTQKFLRGTKPDELSKDIIHNAGAGLKWRASNTSVEFEDVNSVTGLSLRRISLLESVSFITEEEWFFNIGASYTISDYTKSNETVKVGNIVANAEKLVFDNGIFKSEAFLRSIKSDAEDQNDIGFSTSLDWKYNIYDIEVTYMFTNEKNSVTDNTFRNHYVFLNVRRNLF